MTVSPARKRGKNAILALLSKHEHGGIDNPVNSPVLSKRCQLSSSDARIDVDKDDAESDGSDMETAAPLPLEQPQSSEYQDDSDEEDSCGSSGTGTGTSGPLQTARPMKGDKDVCANSSGNTTSLCRIPPSYESHVRRSETQKDIIDENQKLKDVGLQISPAIAREDISLKRPASIRSRRVNIPSSADHADSLKSDMHQQSHGAPNTIQLLGLLRKRKRP